MKYNILNKFLQENSLYNFCKSIKSPEDLLEYMKTFEYGWCDKSGKEYIGDDLYGNIFWDNYRLMLPEEVFKHKLGVCWDQTIFEKYVFDNTFPFESKIIFIQQYKVSTHTFLIYKQNGKWMYFENSFKKHRGIHGPFDNIDSIIKKVYNQMQNYKKGTDGYRWQYMDPNKFEKKLTCKQFMDNCGYDYTKMEETTNINESDQQYLIEKPTKDTCKRYFSKEHNSIELPTCSPNKFDKNNYNESLILLKDRSDYIGFVATMKNEVGLTELNVLWVNPKFRRKGYSEILMGIYTDAEVLYVDPLNNNAIRLYTKLGWKYSGIKKSFNKRDMFDYRHLYYNTKNISLKDVLEKYNV